MTPETSPRPLKDEFRPPRFGPGPEPGDLKPVGFLHDRDGNWVLPPFDMLEVERPDPPQDIPRGPWRTLWPWYVAAVLAPLLVLLGALALPVSDPVRGAVLVGGWILLSAVARWLERRRRHRT